MQKVTVGLFCVCLCVFWLVPVDGYESQNLSTNAKAFSPSNARTEDGNLIPVEQFFPASRCASCHADTHKGWSESLHRNAAREPFYRESADILLSTRGIEMTRHCESCHTPVALFSGALTKESPKQEAPFTKLDDEGVTCTVCHSITEARLDGTGSYTIRRPALLAREDGSPIYGDFTDEQILADVPAHKRAVMRPLLKQPEFCSTCHKVDAPPELNNYKKIRGFSVYDEWQQSGASHEAVAPFYKRESRADCRACHMPKVESLDDRAAKNKMIASHRWLGANTAAPLFYGQSAQVELTKKFLETNVINVDIFAVTSDSTGARFAALESHQAMPLNPNEEITAEVVLANRGAAHSFPPEVRDLYEAWVEFEAIDERGKTIFHSGFVKPDGMLDESAHVYKTVILDESGRHITRHQIWTTTIKAYDNAIAAGRSDVARYRFRLPKAVGGSIRLRARMNYRRFNQEYTDYVLSRQKKELLMPTVKMAEAEVVIRRQSDEATRRNKKLDIIVASPRLPISSFSLLSISTSPNSTFATAIARRWNDYGIGLLEQAQYGAAAEAFRQASALDPTDANLLVNAAIAEMRTERFGPEREQLRKAEALLEGALKMAPTSMRARYFRALVLRGFGRMKEAADELAAVAREYPRDREVQRQFGQTLYTLGRFLEARTALEAIISLDPTDANAYQLLNPIYASQGQKTEAARALSLYFEWRDDPRADAIGARFFAAHPEWAEERVTTHTHGKNATRRPVLTGALAAPEK